MSRLDRRNGRGRAPWGLLAAALLGLSPGATARAGITIVPDYNDTDATGLPPGTTVTSVASNPNAATIESTINQAIQVYNSTFSNNLTIPVRFQVVDTGLGQSSTFNFTNVSYNSYYNALKAADTGPGASAAQITAFNSLPGPNPTTEPVTGKTVLDVPLVNGVALGLFSTNGLPSEYATVSLNTSIMNLSRPDTNPSKYDLETVVFHELDEVLGSTSALDINHDSTSKIHPTDLFRYSGPGARSFTNSSSATAFFSIDNGNTLLVQYNQNPNNGDLGDWVVHTPSQVQDYALQPGMAPNLGTNELTLLNVVGYQLSSASAPEPGALTMVVSIAAGLAAYRVYRWRRRPAGGAEG